jgi:hypothetical protein
MPSMPAVRIRDYTGAPYLVSAVNAAIKKYLVASLGPRADTVVEVRIKIVRSAMLSEDALFLPDRSLYALVRPFRRGSRRKTVAIVVPAGYHHHWRAQWVLVHELAHARQLLEGRLRVSPRLCRLRFRPEGARRFRDFTRRDEVVFRATDGSGDVVEGPACPWEIEANRYVRSVMGEENVVKAARLAKSGS